MEHFGDGHGEQMTARDRQLLHVCDGLPELRIQAIPDRHFFLASDIRVLWGHRDRLRQILPDLSPSHLEVIWTKSLLFITFLAYIEVPTSFYVRLSGLLFRDSPDGNTPCYQDVGMPYSGNQLAALGLSRAKFSRWEEQYLFTPATIVINSPTRWVQKIPDGRTRLPFVECDPGEEHGGYGDVKFFKIAPEYVVDEDPSSGSVVPEHQRQPVVVAVKSFTDSPGRADGLENGRAEAANMRLLKQGQASNHSISLASAVIELGDAPRLLIFYPRAELGDLGQFLSGGKRHNGTGSRLYNFDERFPHAARGWGPQPDLARALLQQCVKLAGALRFLHEGFAAPTSGRWVRCAHMDLKPDNIIIFGGDGAVGRWKLCDFGISVLKEEDDGDDGKEDKLRRRLTLNTRARRGRGQYQAPEVPEQWDPHAKGETGHGVGRSSDIWSFGCIFAEVLAFALEGPEGVKDFAAARRQRFKGIVDVNFHSPAGNTSSPTTRSRTTRSRTTGSHATGSHTIGSHATGSTWTPSSWATESRTLGSRSTAASSHISRHSQGKSRTTSVVRPQVLEWLSKKCGRQEAKEDTRDGSHQAFPPVWSSCWAGHVRRILQVNPSERPDAGTLQRYVHHIWDDALKSPQTATSICEDFRYEVEPQKPEESELRPQQHTDSQPSQPIPPALPTPTTPALSQAAPISFQVPVSSNPLFTGRSSIISKMESFFGASNPVQQRLVLTGLGGVGKTQIATAYAYKAYRAMRYKTVLWVFAINEQELIKSFTQLAKTLGLYPRPPDGNASPDHDPDLPPMALALLQWLSQADQLPWLLVFDNVDDLDNFDVSRFFPRVPWGDILITSRRREAGRLGNAIEVDVMDEEEAIQLLTRCSKVSSGSDNSDARAVAKTLGCLPLALDQAGTYVCEQGISFADYIDYYEKSHAKLLRHKPPRAVWSYEGTVFTTWEISLAAVAKANPLAARLLDLAAFFHADGAPIALICNLAQSHGKHPFLHDFVDFINSQSDYDQPAGPVPPQFLVPELNVTEAAGRLVSYSLAINQTIATHPLVHSWLRERQSPEQRLMNGRAAICLTLRAIVNAYDASRFEEAEKIYPYLFICLDNLHALPILLTDTELHMVGACIIGIDAWMPVSFDHGTLHRADRFYELAAARREGASWRISNGLLALRRAIRLKSMGLRRECSEHCDRFLAAFDQRTRLDKILAASLARTSAPCFFREGDYDGAERVYEYVDDSLDASGAMLARKQLVLGAIKIDRGLPDAAVAVLEACVAPLRCGIGREHFLLRVWHQLMASAYLAQGRPVEAEKTVMTELAGRKELLERGKIEFSFSDYELAEVYAQTLRAQRRFAEGRTWLEDLLGKTASEKPRPARSLAELSLLLVQLDEATSKEGGGVDELMAQVEVKYAEAAAVYEQEWNRGMWSFKHFRRTINEFKARLETS